MGTVSIKSRTNGIMLFICISRSNNIFIYKIFNYIKKLINYFKSNKPSDIEQLFNNIYLGNYKNAEQNSLDIIRERSAAYTPLKLIPKIERVDDEGNIIGGYINNTEQILNTIAINVIKRQQPITKELINWKSKQLILMINN